MERIKSLVKNEKVLIGFLLIVYFVFLLLWSSRESYNSCPDENMRFQIPKFMFEHGKLPTLFDKEIFDKNYGTSYAGMPFFPYMIGAVFMRVASFLGVSDGNLFWAARLVSILAGVVFLFLVIKIADKLFDNKIKKYIMIGLLMFWPQLSFVFTYVNCDAVMLVGVALCILAWIRGIRSKWAIKDCVMLVIGMSIILLSYQNAYGIVLVSAIVFLMSYIKANDDSKKYKTMLLKGIAIIASVFVLAGWFFIRNLMLYDSLFGSNVSAANSEKYAIGNFSQSEMHRLAMEGMTSFSGFFGWFKMVAFSFFGRFGHMDIAFPTIMYWVVLLIMVVILLFAVKRVISKRKQVIQDIIIMNVGFILGSLITIALAFIYSFSDYQPQGKYIMPAVIAFGYYMTLGIWEIREVTKTKFKYIYLIAPIVLLLVDLYAIFFMLK